MDLPETMSKVRPKKKFALAGRRRRAAAWNCYVMINTLVGVALCVDARVRMQADLRFESHDPVQK